MRQPDVYLEIAALALQKVARYLEEATVQEYLADDLRQSAIERQLEIAGDALGQLRKLDPSMFGRIPDGHLIVAFRNVLAHGYASLDHERVYAAARHNAPALLQVLWVLLAEFPEDTP